jgi:hypothetical protein
MFLCYTLDISVMLGREMKRGSTGCMSWVLYIARLYMYIYVVFINKTNAERWKGN